MAVGGVALFGADTVYGLACMPDDEEAVRRLYAIKGRPPAKPSAVLFFSLELALAALPELGPRTTAGLECLMPGAATALLPHPARRFPPPSGGGGGARGPGGGAGGRAGRAGCGPTRGAASRGPGGRAPRPSACASPRGAPPPRRGRRAAGRCCSPAPTRRAAATPGAWP